jgi:hypothetical protein
LKSRFKLQQKRGKLGSLEARKLGKRGSPSDLFLTPAAGKREVWKLGR